MQRWIHRFIAWLDTLVLFGRGQRWRVKPHTFCEPGNCPLR